MSRIEFMEQLEKLLADVSDAERAEALQYYNDYFDDAGKEQEEEVIQELKSPEIVAEIIKGGLNDPEGAAGEFTENGFEHNRGGERFEVKKKAEEKYVKRENDGWKILLILILAVLAIPVGIPIAAVVFSLFVAVLVTAVVFMAVGAATILVFLVGGFALFAIGLCEIAGAPPVGLIFLGGGLLLLGFALIGILILVLICAKVIPVIFEAVVNLCKWPFKNRAKGGRRYE